MSSFTKLCCYYFSGHTAGRFVHFVISTNTLGEWDVHVEKDSKTFSITHGNTYMLFLNMRLYLVYTLPQCVHTSSLLNVHFSWQNCGSAHYCNHVWDLDSLLCCTLLKMVSVDWMVPKITIIGFQIPQNTSFWWTFPEFLVVSFLFDVFFLEYYFEFY